MTGETTTSTLVCPHCHKPFMPKQGAGSRRLRGWKCPHCKLFLPETRAEDAPLSREQR